MIDSPASEDKKPPPAEVFVVDDDEDLLDTLRDVLQEAGYCVQTAVNGHEALARLLGGLLPDLILLDLLMPEMDGWALMAELKARPTLAAIPVVVVSAGGDRVLNSAPVCAGHISKPLALPRLVEVIKRCLLLRPSHGRP